MIRLVVSVFDSASETFGQPFFVTAKAQAIRAFSDEVNRKDANNELCKHPDDFTLYMLGEFDDSYGTFNSTAPEQLIRGKECIAKESNAS